MKLPDFTLHRPTNLGSAFAAAEIAGAGGFDWLGGGTDLLCNYKWGIQLRPHVISLRGVAELRGGEGTLAAGRTLAEIEGDSEIARRWPVLVGAVASIATPLIRQTATLGGNLLLDTRCWHFNQTRDWRDAHGSCLKAEADVCRVVPDPGDVCVAAYSGDLAPVLLVLGAQVVLVGPDGERTLEIERFYHGDGIRRFRDKRPDEILLRVEISAAAESWTTAYRKLRLREAFDFPEGGVAAGVRWDGGVAADLRLATTAYDVVPQLYPDIVAPHVGGALDDAAIDAMADALQDAVRPMRNTSMSPAYRKKMARVLCRRAFGACRPA